MIIELETIDSTNDYIKRNIETFEHMTIVKTNYQTAGKGRNGHIWEANKNDNLLFSFLLKEEINTIELTQVIALSVVRTMNEYGIDALIKWPNDIYVNNEKVCGILVETIYQKACKGIIVGIGLNVNDQMHYSLARCLGHRVDKEEVFIQLLKQISITMSQYRHHQYSQILHIVNHLSYLRNRKVRFNQYGEVEFLSLNKDGTVTFQDILQNKHHVLINEIQLGNIK